jgi:C1A family cysteine protease
MPTIRKFGWRPDVPDARDLKYKVVRKQVTKLPALVDMRKDMPPVYDQVELGSCTANALGGYYEYDQKKQGVESWTPSRLAIYYFERLEEHTVSEDAGAQIRTGIKVLAKKGVCPEVLWPYDITKFTKKPPKKCDKEFAEHKTLEYFRVDRTLNAFKTCLFSRYPFVLGFSVYDSFESRLVTRTGKVPMPKAGESMLGGHAVLAVGYDDVKKSFLMRNSYGINWGIKGYFYLPYDYLLNPDLSDDFWTIRRITG